jgi:uncharacterized membrane protein YphA (DoxX/SURF4 family)|tara:strand:+ start:185 stop:1315 length:1131 start_codon:yes stop_codon:yes gene_type:complete
MPKEKNIEPLLVKIIRIVTGLVFIFSATVKGIDPLGTDYRVVDYLEAYSWYSFIDFSFALTILVISVEFFLGVALLFRLRLRLAALGVLMLMIFFTVVTFIDARYNLITDCGCFGDAIKLTNWQTFYKNIVLLIFAISIFAWRSKIERQGGKGAQLIVLLLFIAGFGWFMSYNYNHLPVVDFRDWEIGNDMKSTGRETIVSYLAYKNKNTGEIKEYISPDYPWNDSVWLSEWEFVDQRIDDSQLVMKHGLIIEDENGNNLTEQIIENPGYQFVLASYDLDEAVGQGMIDASGIFHKMIENNIDVALLTSSTEDVIEKYRKLYTIDYDVYFADDIELKAMIRSNPGLVLLKDGVVISKWHYNDFPQISKVEELISHD